MIPNNNFRKLRPTRIRDKKMKKILQTLLILLTFSTLAFADKPEKFCYDGMCFDSQGWKIQQSIQKGNLTISHIMGAKWLKGPVIFNIYKIKPTEQISIEDYAEERFLTHLADVNDTTVLTKTISAAIEESPFMINNINAKVFYSKSKSREAKKGTYRNKGTFIRVFFFEKDGYFFEIQTISNLLNSEKHTELFLTILNSFTIES